MGVWDILRSLPFAHDKGAVLWGPPLEILIQSVWGRALEHAFLTGVPSDSDTDSLWSVRCGTKSPLLGKVLILVSHDVHIPVDAVSITVLPVSAGVRAAGGLSS